MLSTNNIDRQTISEIFSHFGMPPDRSSDTSPLSEHLPTPHHDRTRVSHFGNNPRIPPLGSPAKKMCHTKKTRHLGHLVAQSPVLQISGLDASPEQVDDLGHLVDRTVPRSKMAAVASAWHNSFFSKALASISAIVSSRSIEGRR